MRNVAVEHARVAKLIRDYFDSCNIGDAERVAAHFTADAVHYFPAGSPFDVLRGARAIGECWAKCVRDLGSRWTVDHVIVDPQRFEAVIEWTHFKSKLGTYLRGDEWYVFDPDWRIREIRAYYACPALPGAGNHEIGHYPYSERGYPQKPPGLQ